MYTYIIENADKARQDQILNRNADSNGASLVERDEKQERCKRRAAEEYVGCYGYLLR